MPQMMQHEPEDGDLYETLSSLMNAPPRVLSHLVASRSKQDKAELERILQHLPSVRDRAIQAPRMRATTGRLQMASKEALASPRPAGSPRPRADEAVGGGGMDAPEAFASPRPRNLPPLQHSPRPTPPTASPRPELPTASPRPQLPTVSPRPEQPTASLGSTQPIMSPRPMQQQQTANSGMATHAASDRTADRLRSIGVDPRRMTAAEMLNTLYARDVGTAYKQMNKEAEKKVSVRVTTPVSFQDVLSPRALSEIKECRDDKTSNTFLNKWEVNFMADVCRSVRTFENQVQGPQTTYTNCYSRRRYGQSFKDRAIKTVDGSFFQ
eukprot:gnl/TRDRNA2_/TRDRNA2_198257_c0_seq1.p1 gnl/TRDRNA2_/TRDRNA2_198257_c0~~gnl/TRDRNA2_/TRDRNA2_198257_c0_seq1.p1  ORF type:complete len:324 (-),score=35.62 gnl/TRDRNA2_/TRDRNA2_198257_c0_seq1:155-1126(-)